MLLSIIIPIYNAEEYLEDTVESILQQSGEYELILVDDGSTDNSLMLCNKFRKSDRRVRVIHTENFGVSHARNIGVAESRGEYIQFVDSDDLLAKSAVHIILEKLQESKKDVYVFSFETMGEEVVECLVARQSEGFKNEEQLIHDLLKNGRLVAVWNKIYKREILSNVRFLEGCSYAEDYLFNLEVFAHIKSIGMISEKMYYHRILKASLSSLFDESLFAIAYKVYDETKAMINCRKIQESGIAEDNLAYNINVLIHKLAVSRNYTYIKKRNVLDICVTDFAIECIAKCYPGVYATILKKKKYSVLLIYIWMLRVKNVVLSKVQVVKGKNVERKYL